MTVPCTTRVTRTGLTRLWVVLVLTLVTLVAEVIGAWVSGSLALLADAGHLLTDAAAVALTLLTAWLATHPATDKRTYGHLRWEVLGALINGAALVALSLWIVVEAVSRFRTPTPVRGGVLLVVAVAGLIANLVALGLLHRDKQGSLNLRGAYLHVLGDVLGSVGAIGAGVVIWFTGWTPADPLISIVLALLILVGAWRLVRESAEVLLEQAPSHLALGEVEGRMLEVAGVTAVHDLHVWTVTSGMVAMSGHAVVPELGEHPRVLAELQRAVSGVGIAHATIQLEVEGPCPEPERGEADSHVGHHHGHSH
ncbi:MAG: cation diffusion facilitator family transporter [Gemmatimonadota bacterium]